MKWFLVIFMFSFCVMAQEVQPQSALDNVIKSVDVLKKAEQSLPVSLPTAALTILGVLSEIGMRVWPTAKPKSWFLVLSSVFGILGSIFSKVSGLLDNVAQNVKEKE